MQLEEQSYVVKREREEESGIAGQRGIGID